MHCEEENDDDDDDDDDDEEEEEEEEQQQQNNKKKKKSRRLQWSLPPRRWFSLAGIGPTPSHHYVPVVTDELLRWRNTCLTKSTNIILVPTTIRFLITPLLSAWHCGPTIGLVSEGD